MRAPRIVFEYAAIAVGLAFTTVACGGLAKPVIRGPICPVDQAACGQVCVTMMSDPLNCGGCGIACSAGQMCESGACQCAAGVVCNGGCVAADSNPCASDSKLVTSAPGAYWNTAAQPTETTSGNADVTVDVRVNDSSTAQTWEGFGGAFNEMGWHYLSMLSPSERDRAIRLLYGTEGARFAFGAIKKTNGAVALARAEHGQVVPTHFVEGTAETFPGLRSRAVIDPHVDRHVGISARRLRGLRGRVPISPRRGRN